MKASAQFLFLKRAKALIYNQESILPALKGGAIDLGLG